MNKLWTLTLMGTVALGLASSAQANLFYYAQGSTITSTEVDGSNQQTVISGLSNSRDVFASKSSNLLYWTDQVDSELQRSNIDGSNVTTLISSGLNAPRGIFVDLNNDFIYIGDRGNSRLARSNIDGTGLTTLVSSTGPIQDVSIDSANSKIYWMIAAFIRRADLDGSNVETVISFTDTGAGGGSYSQFALDFTNQHIYWTDQFAGSGDRIRRVDFDGSNLQNSLITGLDNPNAILIENNFLYYTDAANSGSLHRANLDGTGQTVLATGIGTANAMAIPEPSTYALILGIGCVIGAALWRRKLNKESASQGE